MSGEVSGEGVQMSTNRLSPTTVAITNHYQNHHSQYCTTHTCPFWARIEAIDRYVLTLKTSIDRIKNFGGYCWMYPSARNVKFLRCNHVITISYLRLLAFMKLEEKIKLLKNLYLSFVLRIYKVNKFVIFLIIFYYYKSASDFNTFLIFFYIFSFL